VCCELQVTPAAVLLQSQEMPGVGHGHAVWCDMHVQRHGLMRHMVRTQGSRQRGAHQEWCRHCRHYYLMWATQAALCQRKLPRNVHLGYLMCAARDYRLLTVACCAEAMHTLQWTARPLAVPWAHHSARGVSLRRATAGTVMCSTGMCHDEQARLMGAATLPTLRGALLK
jgi:hypothetical protein